MQCPRCGLQNPPGISACQRCGLAVYSAPPPAGPPSEPAAGGYAQGGYGEGGYSQTGYDYRPIAGQPQNQYENQYQNQPQYQPQYQYQQPSSSPYATGPVTGYGSTAAGWPDSSSNTSGGAAGLARILLLLAVLASAVYAGWAMTARRGIFVDFVDNRVVSLDDAQTSDRTDTILLVIAGALAVLALAVWLIRLIAGRARGGALTVTGFVISGLGLAAVVVGLVLSGTVADGSTRADEGRRAVAATIVTGSGFIALALGLLIGLLVVKARRDDDQAAQPVGGTTPVTPW